MPFSLRLVRSKLLNLSRQGCVGRRESGRGRSGGTTDEIRRGQPTVPPRDRSSGQRLDRGARRGRARTARTRRVDAARALHVRTRAAGEEIDRIAELTGTGASRLDELHDSLRAQPLFRCQPVAQPFNDARGAGRPLLSDECAIAVPTPLVFVLSAAGFEYLDHDGRRLLRLSAPELAAVAEFRKPFSAHTVGTATRRRAARRP